MILKETQLLKGILHGALSSFALAVSICCCQAQDHPYSALGNNPNFIFSFESWEALWEVWGEEDLDEAFLESLREDLIPAILKDAESPEEFREILEKWDRFVSENDWEGMKHSRFGLISWCDPDGVPKFTLALTPPESKLVSTAKTLDNFVRFIAENSDGELEVIEEANRSKLTIANASETENATRIADLEPWAQDVVKEGGVYLEENSGTLWMTVGHTVDEAFAGPGMKEFEGFSEGMERTPGTDLECIILNFTAIERSLRIWQKALVKSATETEMMAPSLVFDETMEEMFKDDPETLSKLKEAQEGMEFFSEDSSEELEKVSDRLLTLLGDLGFLIIGVDGTQEGILTTTNHRPRPGSEVASLVATEPLSEVWNPLMRPDVLQMGAYSLPDLGRIYNTILELIGLAPDGESLLAGWNQLQEAFGLNLGEHFFPAIGRQIAWTQDQSNLGSLSGMSVFSNDLTVFIESPDLSKTRGLLDRLEKILADAGMVASATQIGGRDFKVLDTGYVGITRWTVLEEPPMLVIAKGGTEESLIAALEALKAGGSRTFADHPRWKDMEAAWTDSPHAVLLDDYKTTWRQQIDQLKGTQMMIAMMGGGSAVPLAVIQMVLKMMELAPEPEVLFEVGGIEGDWRFEKSLLLFSQDQSKKEE
jgi:hypothetical protein